MGAGFGMYQATGSVSGTGIMAGSGSIFGTGSGFGSMVVVASSTRSVAGMVRDWMGSKRQVGTGLGAVGLGPSSLSQTVEGDPQ